MSTLVIYNPVAGRARGLRVAELVADCLSTCGYAVDLRPTEGPGGATEAVRTAGWDVGLVVVVGGDGTVNETVNGLAGRDIPLAIVPTGTVNVLALELGLPFSPKKACGVIAEGNALTMDLGLANDRRFCLMAGAGTDARTIHYVDPGKKRRLRELAFISAGARCLSSGPNPMFEVVANDRVYEGTLAVVGNARHYAGRIGLTTRADLTDGMLDVLVYRGTGVVRPALFWLSTPIGIHFHNPDVSYFRTTEVTLRTVREEDEVLLQTDGELVGRLPAVIRVEARALRVLVPSNEACRGT